MHTKAIAILATAVLLPLAGVVVALSGLWALLGLSMAVMRQATVVTRHVR